MITFKHILHIRQIMLKNLIILAKEKSLSTYLIIEFFSFLFILQNVFYFIFFVFVHKNHFRKENNICIYIIWFLKKYMKDEMNSSLIEQTQTISLRFDNVFYFEESRKFIKKFLFKSSILEILCEEHHFFLF